MKSLGAIARARAKLRSLGVEASAKAVGKSADPDFIELTCYIRKETHLKEKQKLLDRGGGQLCDLVEELIHDLAQKIRWNPQLSLQKLPMSIVF